MRWPILFGVAGLALMAAACAAPASPRGWAPAQPVVVEDREYVLAPHRRTIYGVRTDSSFVQWQFPPQDRDSYPISEQRLEGLLELIDALDVSTEQKEGLESLAESLTVSGGSDDALKDALTDTVGDDQREAIEAYIDDTRETENDALRDIRALYGELAVSDDSDTAYVGAFGGWVFAIETTTGRTRWVIETKDEIVGGIAREGDTLYFGTKGEDVWAVNADDGSVRWRFEAEGQVWSKPAVTDDAIYVTTMDGFLQKLDRDGAEEWSFDAASAGIASSPVVSGDAVYFGAFDKNLYAVNTDDGTMKWSFGGDNWFWGGPVIGDGVVYAPNLDGRVYAVREDDGSRVWDFDAGAPIRSAPAIAEDALVVAARDGDVYKLNLETGKPIGGALVIDSTIESNLNTDGNGRVFVVPRDPTLYVIDATGNLTVSTFQLNR